jgi:dCMP deaminase
MNKWELAYMDTAERFGALSTATRLKVGAIVVKDGRIISIGYNGTPSGWDNCCEDEDNKTKPEVSHAEENALGKLAASHESGYNAHMYITHSPCLSCAKLIYNSGISKVYYREKYRSDEGIMFLLKCGIEVNQI